MPPQHPARSLVVIGFGAMASAIVEGALRKGALRPEHVFAADPTPDRRTHAERLGCASFERAHEALDAAPRATILLAVKPQMLESVARDAGECLAPLAVISILAGATLNRLAESLGAERLVRVMPNTPARIGKGISALVPGPGATPDDAVFARTLFEAVGETIDLDESLMDAFTALGGSGPAYLFYLAEAMTRAAQEVGFDPDIADRLVRATLVGAAGLFDADRVRTPNDLRALVTSKGGTTAAATRVLDDSGVMDAFVRAVVAARDRGRELSNG